jgi:very-short-patch-repair endonuclease
MRRDRRKDHALRSHGLTPIRYSDEQLEQREELIAELTKLL